MTQTDDIQISESLKRRLRLAMIALLATAAVFTPAGLLLWLGPTQPVHEWVHDRFPQFHNCGCCEGPNRWSEGHPSAALLGKSVTFVALLQLVALAVLVLNCRARNLAEQELSVSVFSASSVAKTTSPVVKHP